MRRNTATVATFALVLCLARGARADVVILTDGTQIEGEVLRESDDEIEIKIPHGATTLPRSRVKEIVRKATPEQEFERRRKALAGSDAEGRIALAVFASDHHFPWQRSADLALEAFAIDATLDGSVDILKKLDYRFETDTWVDPEKWFAGHGYVRRDGRWITPEEATLRDLAPGIVKARDGAAQTVASVHEAEAIVAGGPGAEADARARIKVVNDALKVLEANKDAAKATLDARDTDLKIAADRTLAARRDLTTLQQQPAPTDPAAKADYQSRLALADGLVRSAALDESRARAARDKALDDVQVITTAETEAPGRIHAIEVELEARRARIRAAQDDLPRRRSLAAEAATALARLQASEAAAREALLARKTRDETADLERWNTLRRYREKKADEKRGPK
jgi:hypothetical protein